MATSTEKITALIPHLRELLLSLVGEVGGPVGMMGAAFVGPLIDDRLQEAAEISEDEWDRMLETAIATIAWLRSDSRPSITTTSQGTYLTIPGAGPVVTVPTLLDMLAGDPSDEISDRAAVAILELMMDDLKFRGHIEGDPRHQDLEE